MFKKKKQKIISDDISTIEYWQAKIKPGMKLNNHKLHDMNRYANFVVPFEFKIIKGTNGKDITISFEDTNGSPRWYDVYRNYKSVEIIQEDIMNPKH